MVVAKHYIYKNKFSAKQLKINYFISRLKVKFQCERYIANINNKVAKFLKKNGLHSTIILTIIKTIIIIIIIIIIITIIIIIIIIIRIMGERNNVYIQMPTLIQSKLFITSLVITEYSISDINLLGTDLSLLKFPLYNRIFT